MNGSSWYYDSYYDWSFSPHPAEERNMSVMVILPTVTAIRKIKRGLNRLLPKGRRCRGDIKLV